MKACTPFLLGILVCPFAFIGSAEAQTAFTYQGQLSSNGNATGGLYDFRFRLAADPLANNYVGGNVFTNGVPISNGLFMATMDFGGVFNGSNYWLEVSVRTNGGGSYTTLSPLQPLTPTPYAIFAAGASNVLGIVPGGGLSGSYSSAVTFNNAGNSFSGSFTGNGAGISNVNAATLGGIAPGGFWKTTGNSGTLPGASFVGTTDNQPLEFRVNGQRALRLESNSPDAPNFVAGYSNNVVGPGITSATIGGGGHAGATNRISGVGFGGTVAGGNNNSVLSFSGVVSGGANNTAAANAATISGGSENYAGGDHDFIAGGKNNFTTNSFYASIGGGLANTNETSYSVVAGGYQNGVFSLGSVIGGGYQNQILNAYAVIGGGYHNQILGPTAVIGGGEGNLIGSAADHATIAGGFANTILGSDGLVMSTIGGGSGNMIQADTAFATIAGGISNAIQTASHSATIGGGANNVIQTGSTNSVIAGGINNVIHGIDATIGGGSGNSATNDYATVGGGNQNVAGGFAAFVGGGGYNGATFLGNQAIGPASTISGGLGNLATNQYATVGGGYRNLAGGNMATVSGGDQIMATGSHATAGGGFQNSLSGNFATVAGGYQNTAGGIYATVPGGTGNQAGGAYSFAAGNSAHATFDGAFVWADSQNAVYSSDRNDQFKVRAAGGMVLDVSGSSHLNPAAFLINSTSATGVGLYIVESSTDAAFVVNNSGAGSIIKGFNGGANAVFEVVHDGTVFSKGVALTSDRNVKDHFESVDTQAVLARVAALPLSEWSYRDDPRQTRHVGPVAQDFHAAFGLNGADDKHISMVDEGGIALAAIQGLNQKLADELKQKEAEITKLEQRLEALEKSFAIRNETETGQHLH
jgi:hypothetical protein